MVPFRVNDALVKVATPLIADADTPPRVPSVAGEVQAASKKPFKVIPAL